MCGRYTLSTPGDLLVELFELDAEPQLAARFNIAPTQEAPVLRVAAPGDSRRLTLLRWGLVPSWAKSPDIGNRMINARAETVADKPAYRSSFRRRRCLVVADGFYEWQRTGGPKQPFLFRLAGGSPFAMAGLWDRWDKGEGEALETFTVLTTAPNDLVQPVHRRMPVILPPTAFEDWLDPELEDRERLLAHLQPLPSDQMEGFPVSTWVNNPANEGPRCVEPLR